MKKFLTIFAVVALIMAVGSTAQSASYSYTVTPNDLADALTFVLGGEPFGYDWDSVKPLGVFQAGPSGFGDSSFWADVQGSAAGGGVDYTAIRLSPKDIFGGVSDVTISDLSEISYYTKWISGLDWQIKIYTIPFEGGWYGHRFNFKRPNPADNDWHQYNTTTDLAVEWIVSGIGASEHPSGVFLTDLDVPYGSETIMFIDIISSYMTDSPPGDSYLDGIGITLGSDTATMDLAAVPIPGAVWLLGSGLVGLIGIRRKLRS